MRTICLKSLIEHYLKKESFKICFFPFEITNGAKLGVAPVARAPPLFLPRHCSPKVVTTQKNELELSL